MLYEIADTTTTEPEQLSIDLQGCNWHAFGEKYWVQSLISVAAILCEIH